MGTEQEWIDYLLLKVKLDKNIRYVFWYTDGTGYCGMPHEFAQYAVRRFKVQPDESFEIDHDTGGDESFEILAPTHEGQRFGPMGKDPRF